MLRLNKLSRPRFPLLLRRRVSTSSSSGIPTFHPSPSPISRIPKIPHPSPPSTVITVHLSPPTPSTFLSSTSLIAAFSAATLLAAYAATTCKDGPVSGTSKSMYADFGTTIEKSRKSIDRIVNRIRQTGVAACVLWQSLRSVMPSANHEVRAGFELRVAALLADIVAASDSRRVVIGGVGSGAVVDWPLKTVVGSKDGNGTQAESVRVLAYLIADPNTCRLFWGDHKQCESVEGHLLYST